MDRAAPSSDGERGRAAASYPGQRDPTRSLTIRTRRVALSLAVALGLAACGTWDPTAAPDATRTDVIEPEAPTTGAQMEMSVGDGTFNFSVTECFADPDEGVRVTGRTEDGNNVSVQYDPEAPDDATVVVTNQEGVMLYSADGTTGTAPEFQVTQDGFRATGAFVSDQEEDVEGSLSGTC